MFIADTPACPLSGERFFVVYLLCGNREEAFAKATDICFEQTVEFPDELLPSGFIRDGLVGRIESFAQITDARFQAVISYAIETTANELTQLLNVIFGNISIKPGVRVERIELPQSLLKHFKGPRWGKAGLRQLLDITNRPLLFTALKPMGLPAADLAELAYKFAVGGIDIIKDDHGITNQQFATFNERLERCVAAVARANRETGRKTIYVANINAPYHEVIDRARQAKAAGAGGLLIAPGLVGFDLMRTIADDDAIGLPIFSHPTFLGSYVLTNNGIAHHALFGQIQRLAGADAVIYPNFGGRFAFTLDECRSIVAGANIAMGELKSIFPCPAGGIGLGNIPELLDVYGNEVIFLMGGGLFKHSPDLVENCRYFRSLVGG